MDGEKKIESRNVDLKTLCQHHARTMQNKVGVEAKELSRREGGRRSQPRLYNPIYLAKKL